MYEFSPASSRASRQCDETHRRRTVKMRQVLSGAIMLITELRIDAEWNDTLSYRPSGLYLDSLRWRMRRRCNG